VRDFRRSCRQSFGLALARAIGPRRFATTLDPKDVSTVLVCRVNGRIGNMMFLTSGIRRLHEMLPHAAIDLVLAHPMAGDLMGKLPGVRRVVVFPHKTPKMVWRFFAALRSLRSCRYDLVIDPTPESTSGRAVLTLCRADRRLGFATRSQWAPLTHAVAEPEELSTMHQAARLVFLLCRIFNAPYQPQSVQLWLPLHADEITAGRTNIARATAGTSAAGLANTFGFFAHAANLKVIDRSWWLAFWQAFLALEPDAVPVEFLPSPAHAPVSEHFPRLHVPSLRGLTAAIAATRMFISTDTGPMHLASSTDVPTVGLFQASDPVLFRPLKPNDLAIDITQCSPHTAAHHCQRIWRRAHAPGVTQHLPA
jgi:ADP-heptose:LPS heptosyltransferase